MRATKQAAEGPGEELRGWVRTACEIDPLDLERSFRSIPGELARVGQLYADALECALDAERVEELVMAQLSLTQRELLRDDKGRGPSVDEVKAHVTVSPDYQKARKAYISAECERDRCRRLLDALQAKKDALISLGAHLRAEMGGSPSIKSAQRQQHEVESNK